MPYVDLHCKGDYASIWYTTNTPLRNVGGFDPEKPTVIMLHPMYLDSSWLHLEFGHTRLNADFNLIAFDMRVCGKSTARPSGKHDSWVEAADLAFLHQALHLPPSHILAEEVISINCALRFASLFPEMCLSLTLVNVPPPTELEATSVAFEEILRQWCFASDIESFEHMGMEAANVVLGADADPYTQDDLIFYWEINSPPYHRRRLLEMVNVVLNRSPLNPKVHASITQPVLIVQGERSELCPISYAQKLVEDLVNAEGGVKLYTVKGATGFLCIVPSTASITNQVFIKFVSSLPPARSDIRPPSESVTQRMQTALKQLSEMMENPEIATRDPLSSLSFSCLTPEVIKSQDGGLTYYGNEYWKAYSPLGLNGRPLRSFSERKASHWFQTDRDGLSHTEPELVARVISRRGSNAERPDSPVLPVRLPKSEPVASEAAEDGRPRRTTFNATSVDKVILKGSLDMVITSASVLPFRRL